jgi:type 1 glutamine amidotransferase
LQFFATKLRHRGTAMKHLILSLLFVVSSSFAADVKKLLIVGQGSDGHPPTTHEFMPGAKVLAELLKLFPEIQTTVVDASEPWAGGDKLIDACDGIAMFISEGSMWMQKDASRYAAIKRLAARGGAIIALHWSVGAKDAQYIPGQLELLGATRGGEQRKYTKIEVELKKTDSKHPIMNGVPDMKVYDEFYYALDQAKGIHPLITANIEGKDETAVWSWERPDSGRSFGFVMLHYHSNWQREDYRRFIVQGVLWSLKQDIPEKGVKVDIDSKLLELDGVLPPPAAEGVEKPAKKKKK